MSYSDNLPPGVTTNMLPGNRPEDGEMSCRECSALVVFSTECEECGALAPDYFDYQQDLQDEADDRAFERYRQEGY